VEGRGRLDGREDRTERLEVLLFSPSDDAKALMEELTVKLESTREVSRVERQFTIRTHALSF
jgi:hypothetical protein